MVMSAIMGWCPDCRAETEHWAGEDDVSGSVETACTKCHNKHTLTWFATAASVRITLTEKYTLEAYPLFSRSSRNCLGGVRLPTPCIILLIASEAVSGRPYVSGWTHDTLIFRA